MQAHNELSARYERVSHDNRSEAGEAEADRVLDGLDATLTQLLNRPAPNAEAIAWKFDKMLHELKVDTWPEPMISALETLKSDVVRLANRAAAS